MFPPNNHHHLREKPDEHGQQTFHNNYYNYQHFGQPQEYFRQHSKTASTMQDGFDFASQKSKLSKKRKAEDQLIDVHGGGGGGSVVRSTVGKDKHSKVCTARGPRDRRLRLSPKTAIQFYDVQDRLGYDRPSKAIDWLIKEAKSAIDALNDAAVEICRSPPSYGGERRFLDDEKPISGFGNFLLDGAAAAPPPSSSTEFPFHHLGFGQGFCAVSDLKSTCPDIFMENTNFQAQPIILANSQMFYQREPLQSSFINNYSPISTHFPTMFGFSDGNELSSITGAATLKDDEKDKELFQVS